MQNANEIITEPIAAAEISQIENIELLFFAYRDFVSDPDRILDVHGFGRAHHRVLYFVNRSPGLTVAELLEILRITKQSLGRVLKQLVQAGYVIQTEGERDRRKRLLFPTIQGRELILELSAPQSKRFERALMQFDDAEREKIIGFLRAMIGTTP
ncbi:MAG: MarR family transcriptional regulator [Pseudomonadota bacterium]